MNRLLPYSADNEGLETGEVTKSTWDQSQHLGNLSSALTEDPRAVLN